MIQTIVMFLLALFAGLAACAEYVHDGKTKAGEEKKAFVLAQLGTVLAGPVPAVPGLNPSIQAAVLAVTRILLPLFGGRAIDWLVDKLNSSSFFVQIEHGLAESLTALTGGSSTPSAS